jgi:hypothetical protein
MTSSFQMLRQQTLTFRQKLREILLSIPQEDRTRIPEGWNNHALWHAGHLLITPRLLGLGLSGRALGAPAKWRGWFAKDSSPRNWPPQLDVPAYEELVDALVPTMEEVFSTVEDSAAEPFPQAYLTSAGIVLHHPHEALQFSFCHDGIHLGLLLALRRDLKRSSDSPDQ